MNAPLEKWIEAALIVANAENMSDDEVIPTWPDFCVERFPDRYPQLTVGALRRWQAARAEGGEPVAWASVLEWMKEPEVYPFATRAGAEAAADMSRGTVRPLVFCDGHTNTSVFPEEPTEEMLEACMSDRDRQHPANAKRYLRHVYKKMLANLPNQRADSPSKLRS